MTDSVPIDEHEDPHPTRRWTHAQTTQLVTMLAEAVDADVLGDAVAAALELGRRIERGEIADRADDVAHRPGPQSNRTGQ